MLPRTRQGKKRTESMQVTAGDRRFDDEQEDDDEEEEGDDEGETRNSSPYASRSRPTYSTTTASLASLAGNDCFHLLFDDLFIISVPIHRRDDDDDDPEHAALIAQVAKLLQESDLTDLISLDWIEQIRFFLNERSKFLHQVRTSLFICCLFNFSCRYVPARTSQRTVRTTIQFVKTSSR